jgi:glycolate oxidase FAD binding subunit
VVLKANLSPGATAAFLNQARGLPAVSRLDAVPGSGAVRVIIEGAHLTAEKVRETVDPLLDSAAAAQGNLIVERAPAAWKAELPVWGRPRGDAWLMRAVKDKLDPRRLFNPGRFVDGI